jgi:hypothetical protein
MVDKTRSWREVGMGWSTSWKNPCMRHAERISSETVGEVNDITGRLKSGVGTMVDRSEKRSEDRGSGNGMERGKGSGWTAGSLSWF